MMGRRQGIAGLAAWLGLMAFSGCSALSPCYVSLDQLEARQITDGLDGPVGSLHRAQGIFRAGFELHNLAPAYEGSLYDLGTVDSGDFCLGVDESCQKELEQATRAKGWEALFNNVGVVDAVVRFNGTAPPGSGCPRGSVTIVNLVSARPIAPKDAFAGPLRAEVRHRGDDGLTARFADSVETAFRTSEPYTVVGAKPPGKMIVMIPTHVGWKRVGARTRMTYSVEFSWEAARPISKTKGSCWDDELSKCAQHVVREAEAAATGKP